MPASARHRVLLLDDDPTVRHFVALALEELGVDLIGCNTVPQALAALREAPCRLVLSDLVLREGSGFDLLHVLQRAPALLAGGRVVVFSAAIDEEARGQLIALGVWRMMHKPASLASLQACTLEALEAKGADQRAGSHDSAAEGLALSSQEHDAVQRHFGGDRKMFEAFRASCQQQIPEDLREADQALASHDVGGVQRLCHSLKTVLSLLGQPALAAQASALDEAAVAADWPRILSLWASLRGRLLDIGTAPG